MPKERKTSSKAGTTALRHQPLDRAIKETKVMAEGKLAKADPRKSRAERADAAEDDDGLTMGQEFLDEKMSKKLLKQAHEQREEETRMGGGGGGAKRAGIGMGLLSMRGGESSDEEEDAACGLRGGSDDEGSYDEEYELGSDGYVDIGDMEGVTDAEQAVMSSFFGGTSERRTINDMIMEKIREKEEAAAAIGGGGSGEKHGSAGPQLPEKVVQVYTEIAQLLKHYKAGKLPKAFKIIPSLTNWEEVLWLTKPDEWSPAAVYAATRIFASNFNERMAQRFFNLILLGRVQDDIERNGRLNFHLFTALRKSVYKPAAFYKGILLPLAAGNCSLKEATVIAAVLARVSVPANHSAVALLKLSAMPYSGPTSLFIRVLLNKKYALPHRVVDALVDHFLGFEGQPGDLPVLWHQSLLVFAQRYKHDVSAAQKERLKQLLKVKFHHMITPEVRRELFSGHSRGEAPRPAAAAREFSGFSSGGALSMGD